MAQGDENEIKLLQNFNSPFIVQYVESFRDSRFLYIVMEYCENGNLRDTINDAKKRGFQFSEDVCPSFYPQPLLLLFRECGSSWHLLQMG